MIQFACQRLAGHNRRHCLEEAPGYNIQCMAAELTPAEINCCSLRCPEYALQTIPDKIPENTMLQITLEHPASIDYLLNEKNYQLGVSCALLPAIHALPAGLRQRDLERQVLTLVTRNI